MLTGEKSTHLTDLFKRPEVIRISSVQGSKALALLHFLLI